MQAAAPKKARVYSEGAKKRRHRRAKAKYYHKRIAYADSLRSSNAGLNQMLDDVPARVSDSDRTGQRVESGASTSTGDSIQAVSPRILSMLVGSSGSLDTGLNPTVYELLARGPGSIRTGQPFGASELSSAEPAHSLDRAIGQRERHEYTDEAHGLPMDFLQDHISEHLPQPNKELALFLQHKSHIKKLVLPDGVSELSIARLQLAFEEKFAWSTHHNGNDLPEIYIQDPVSGVCYELEDLSDVKEGSVLVLNVEVLDKVKRQIDESLAGLPCMVEGFLEATECDAASVHSVGVN